MQINARPGSKAGLKWLLQSESDIQLGGRKKTHKPLDHLNNPLEFPPPRLIRLVE